MTADDTETQRVEAASVAYVEAMGLTTLAQLTDEAQASIRSSMRVALTAARAVGDDPAAEVADHEAQIKAEAWDEGVAMALNFARRERDGITLRLDEPNPYRAAALTDPTPGEERGDDE